MENNYFNKFIQKKIQKIDFLYAKKKSFQKIQSF